MDIFETLVDDHRLIQRVIKAFECFITETESEGAWDLTELNRFAVFFREFVDLLHHDREELVLFPAMGQLGYAPSGAPIAHIRDQHRRERGLVVQLQRAAVKARAPGVLEHGWLVKAARELIAFERQHMKAENELLYPSVQKEFAGKTLADVVARLSSRAEAEGRLFDEHWLRDLATELIRDHHANDSEP
jgi:hemerythrin-like domain-containing protein